MKSMLKTSAFALVGSVLLAGAAQASPMTWTDIKDFNPQYVASGGEFSYQHDINAHGFNAATDDVYSYSLTLNLYDDETRDSLEIVTADVSDMLGGIYLFDLGGVEKAWSLKGYYQLNNEGLLDVTVYSLTGDFYLGSSTLVAKGDGRASSVPEPATLGLMGLGLLGAGFAARRRKA